MFPIPISKTKIIPPRRRAELLTRKRLLDMLFEGLDKKLTLVSAPAGYGKTSLLIDLVHQDDLPCCWLSLDELDREPQRFAAYFIAALAERFPGFGGQSKTLLEGMNSFEQEMERLIVTLVNELYEQVKEHFVLILDDFHLLEGVQPIYNFVNRFVQLVDDNCHLVVSSRVLTNLNDLPLFVAREQVSGLSYSDLAFQQHELQALLAQNGGVYIPDEEARRLIEETEGWVTGLQFSNSGLLGGNLKRAGLETGNRSGLFDYLGQQVLDRQPPELQEFVLRTSLLGEFDATLCQAVLAPMYSEPQDWQNWIKTITRNNLFALPVGEDGRWLRYHHLFQDFIRERFKRDYPEEVQPILTRLQAAYESMNEWVKAHHICMQLNDVGALADLIERAGTSMLQNAHLTLESWLRDLPISMLRTKPGLLSIRGAIVHLKGDAREALRLLKEAEQRFRKSQDVYGMTLALVRQATVNRFLGNYAESLSNAEEVIHLTEASDTLQEFYADALRVKGLALYRLGKARESVDCLESSLNIHIRLGQTSQIPVLMMETGMAYRAVGDFTAAQNAYIKALQIWKNDGNLYWQAILLNNLGVLYQMIGEYEKSALAFEEGLLCAQRSNHIRLNGLISISMGDLFAELEDFDMARENYLHAADVLKGMSDLFLSHSLALAQANLAILGNDLSKAEVLLDQVKEVILAGGSKYEKSLLNLISGRLALHKGDTQKALDELGKAETHFLEDDRDVEVNVTRVWLAACHVQNGSYDIAVQILTELSSTKGKYHQAALMASHQVRNWLEKLKGRTTAPRAVRDWFSQVERLAGKIPGIRRQLRRQARVVSGPIPHLVIQAFGQASVSIDGRLLTNSDWQTQSVRELFFYLLSTPKPLTKEQIGDALWQDVFNTAKVKLRFKNEVYRLRRAVGQDVILFKDVYYSFNRNLDYEYDVEAFEAYLARAKSAEDPKGQAAFYQSAVDLVHGSYLNDFYADWVIPDRERLGLMYLNALLTLADLYLKQAQLDASITVSQRAMDYDPGCEPAYQISMQAYGRRGNRVAIKRVYQACREAMKKQFDLPPSKETEQIYRRLVE